MSSITKTPAIEFDRGIFTISLDFELIWGVLDLPYYKSFLPLCAVERSEIVGRLLELFATYDVSASWCTVGHLFLDQCGDGVNRAHPQLRRSTAFDTIRM